ncbi:MAG TPA: HDIG domain-containing metalloprotein [Gemmatimonadota bacterium]|jgi:putative nucleotidyltransferase with HDIG domain
MILPTREESLALLREHTQADHLLKHMLAVEAAMVGQARRLGGDPELWGRTGLLHDMDYERHPTPAEHPYVGVEILRGRGYPEEMLRAILSHADYSGVARGTPMEHALYAVDELSGFVVACALVRPSRSLDDLTPRSVQKKFKSKAFAAGVKREDCLRGAGELGLDFDTHVANLIEDLRPAQESLGLERAGGTG